MISSRQILALSIVVLLVVILPIDAGSGDPSDRGKSKRLPKVLNSETESTSGKPGTINYIPWTVGKKTCPISKYAKLNTDIGGADDGPSTKRLKKKHAKGSRRTGKVKSPNVSFKSKKLKTPFQDIGASSSRREKKKSDKGKKISSIPEDVGASISKSLNRLQLGSDKTVKSKNEASASSMRRLKTFSEMAKSSRSNEKDNDDSSESTNYSDSSDELNRDDVNDSQILKEFRSITRSIDNREYDIDLLQTRGYFSDESDYDEMKARDDEILESKKIKLAKLKQKLSKLLEQHSFALQNELEKKITQIEADMKYQNNHERMEALSKNLESLKTHYWDIAAQNAAKPKHGLTKKSSQRKR